MLLLPVIYLGFVSLGLPDGTMGVAWPKMHRDLALPVGLAGVLMLWVTMLAAFSGFSSGAVLRRVKTGPVVLISCLLTGTALLMLAEARSIVWLLLAAVPLGLGAGSVDTALNGYVARHYTGRHMNWLHACWGIGATCGPLLMTRALASAAGWRGGYWIIGSIQLVLAAIFLCTLPLWSSQPEIVRDKSADVASGPV
ncbi:MAG TPA: MFS transporter, partial [Opitutaceae bacterium]|nr:MFS transporter [Opitutaceae bacterium]